jgi:hypothetical protein
MNAGSSIRSRTRILPHGGEHPDEKRDMTPTIVAMSINRSVTASGERALT